MLRNLARLPKYISNENTLKLIRRYAGHSKWANIRHIKGLKDGQKSSLFTRLGRQMRVAITEGGSIDPSKNNKLEQIVEQAKRLNMPASTIQSIIKSTQTDKNQCKSYMLEIKGPGSCIVLCELYTENLHQQKQLIATMLRKYSSKFADGGAKHIFEQKGVIQTDYAGQTGKSEAEILETATDHAIEVGAEEVKEIEEGLEFTCDPNVFQKVQKNLQKLNYKICSASVEFAPNKLQTLSDTDLEACSNLFDRLEKLPDVVRLYDNIA